MTTTIGIRFPLGRYHATPWGRQVNESVVEWPPSPWRILRALFATWRWRRPELDESVVWSVLDTLADAPQYWLPRHAEGHTRHYMPDFGHGPAVSKDKTLDPFAAVPRDEEVLVRWSGTLDGPSGDVLAQLCGSLSYLGRAESICEARVVPETELPGGSRWIVPGGHGELADKPTGVLVPAAPLDRTALLMRTTQVRRQRRTSPPGSRWVPYQVPAPERAPAMRPRRPRRRKIVDTVVLRLSGKVLPGVHDTVKYGDVLRQAAMDRHVVPSPNLSGHGSGIGLDGQARGAEPSTSWRMENHAHAHYLVIDANGDRMLDTAIVWAPNHGEGFTEREIAALLAVDRLTADPARFGGFRPVRVAAVDAGRAADIMPRRLCSTSSTWESLTPFLPYRHQKRRQSLHEFLTAEIRRELVTRGLPDAEVEQLPGDWLSYHCSRSRRQPGRGAFGLRLQFESPLPTPQPLVLGDLSHFGLGLFGATDA